ncbi:MAG: transglutaminaseTgpA domain-containing protein, partial [Nitrospira sp.]
MSLEQAFRISSVLLAGVSFIALVLGTGLPAWLVFFTTVALLLAFVGAVGAMAGWSSVPQAARSTITWNVLVLAAFFGFVVDSLTSDELLYAGLRFLLVLMIMKLFHLRHRGDYLHLLAITVVMMLAAALGADLWYVPLVIAYFVLGVWTLFLYGMTRPLGTQPFSPVAMGPRQQTRYPSGLDHGGEKVTVRLLQVASGLALAVLGLTVLFFYMLPRLDTKHPRIDEGTVIRTAGFSQSVDLGALGPMKLDPRIVMRVELLDQASRERKGLYLRGMAFDHYDGRSWVNRLGRRWPIHQMPQRTFALQEQHGGEQMASEPFYRQRILLEPLDTPVLFGVPFIETVRGKLPAVQVDGGGSFYLSVPIAKPLEYTAVSRPTVVLPADLRPPSSPYHYHDAVLQYFTQVPAQSDRVAALARTVAQHARTPFEQARAVQDYLARHYRYSLELVGSEQTNPLEEFLFERKTGYCEHYATAMAIMLRTLGVPSRLATGFLATEWNEYGNYYVVRQ